MSRSRFLAMVVFICLTINVTAVTAGNYNSTYSLDNPGKIVGDIVGAILGHPLTFDDLPLFFKLLIIVALIVLLGVALLVVVVVFYFVKRWTKGKSSNKRR